jgi:hypothetical protein
MENESYEMSLTKEMGKAFLISAAGMAGGFAGLLGIGLVYGHFAKKSETPKTTEGK